MIFIKIKWENNTIYLNVDPETTSLQIKRLLKQYTNRQIKDMRLLLPRNLNKPFRNEDTLKKFLAADGENIILQLRDQNNNKFPPIPSLIMG